MSIITKKICLLGDFNVGKTSLIRRFVEDKFSDKYLSTVGVKISRKFLRVKKDLNIHQVNLILWDLEGKTKFKAITPSYLTGASGFIIVADLSRINTLNNLSHHIELSLKANPAGNIAIALNKADLIPEEKLTKLLENYNFIQRPEILLTSLTSAKTGKNVEEIFIELAQATLE